MKTVFRGSTHGLAKELAPPGKPLPLRLFGTDGEATIDGLPRSTIRRKTARRPSLTSIAARVYAGVVWTLGGLAVVLLLLASRKAGSSQELLSAAQHGTSVGAVIAARGAASVPLFLGALGALAAACGLVLIQALVAQLWQERVIAYQRALKNWHSTYYCPTDSIVFIRTVTAVRWDSVEELHCLIAQDGPGPPDRRRP
ncbi:MAG TPA: hypothetical protein VFZ25_10755 [Chloroflexota bacterium]|nr:hypothetical protein [Chloroflexota bacterium]